MATLPDLDTTTIGYVAYWNAIDQGGVNDIDPDDVLTSSRIIDYTLYDNGVEGRYNSITGRNITFRVKEDGWMVTYFDRTNNFSTQNGGPNRGYWDVLDDWTDVDKDNERPPSDLIANTLSTAINELRTQFGNSSSMNFSHSDTGLFNYEFDTATNSTGLSESERANFSNITRTPGFSYTSATDLLYTAAIGAVDNSEGQDNPESTFEGVTLAQTSGGGREYGTVDAIVNGLVSNAETEYEHVLAANGSNDENGMRGEILALWN